MRFDDEFYLKDYTDNHRFPKIHDDLFVLISNRMSGHSCLDLCGNHGLLGQRLIDELDVACVLVEGHKPAIEMAERYETSVPKVHLRISRETYPDLARIIQEHKVTVLVARRCISELFKSVADPDRLVWADMLADSGIKEVFLQGRAPTRLATHPLPSVAEEVHCFPNRYALRWKQGQLAYLRAI
jgi:hypothetical protein